MSMLRVNGREITIASLEEMEPEVGARGQSVAGTELVDRIGYVRRWNGRTPALEAGVVRMIRAVLRGDGDVFPCDADLYSGKGVAPIAGSVTTLRSLTAADGDPVVDEAKFVGAVSVEEAATNIFPQNVRTGTDTLGDTTSFVAVAGGAIASSGVQFWENLKSLRVISAGAGDGFGVNNTAAAAGTAYAFSGYVWCGNAGITLTVDILEFPGLAVIGTTPVVTVADTWVRWIVSATTTGAATGITVQVTDGAGAGDTFYFDGLQLEANADSIATSWVDGVRAAGILRYPVSALAGFVDITANVWVRIQPANSAVNRYIMFIVDSANNSVFNIRRLLNADTLIFYTEDTNGGNADSLTYATNPFADGDWHMITAVMRNNPATGVAKKELYYDGASVATSSPGGLPIIADAAFFNISTFGAATQWTGGQIDDLKIVPYAANGAQVAAWFAMGKAMSLLPRVYVDGDFIADAAWTTEALGKIGKSAFRIGNGDNNRREMSFELKDADLQTG